MLNIVGLGCAYPHTIIDNNFLLNWIDAASVRVLEERSGITKRASTLSLQYIFETANRNPESALKNSVETPTELACRAVESALAMAQIDRENIGLIVSDCLTPWETIPAEAARIGKALNIKVPCYDILGTGSALFFVDLLTKWRQDRIPDYTLFVTVSTPTQRINYQTDYAGYYFGDCAVAFIIAKNDSKGLSIIKSDYGVEKQEHITIGLYNHLQLDLDKTRQAIMLRSEGLLQEVYELQDSMEVDPYVILPQFESSLEQRLRDQAEIKSENCLSVLAERGCCLAASGMAVLAQNVDNIAKGRAVLMIEVGPGSGYGYGVFLVQ